MKLYELSDQYAMILSQLSDLEDGEIPEDISAALDAIEGDITERADGICMMIQQLRAEGQMLEAEGKRLELRATSRYRSADTLRLYLHDSLSHAGMDKVKTPRFTVWVQQSPPAVQWEGDDIPEEFRRVTVAVDKAKALEVYKSGGELPAGFTVSRGSSLRIK